MAQESELTHLLDLQNVELEEDETIDDSTTTVQGITSLIPIEDPPHGRHLGLYSTVVLFICRMVGSGIFATPGGIYKDVNGSPLVFLGIWIIGAFTAFTGLSVFLELGSLLPRSGGTKIFLEYLFPKPIYYSSFIFGSFNVFFNISGGNALVFGQYIRYALGLQNDENKSRNLGLCLMFFALIIHGLSRKIGLHVQNIVGGLKIFLSTLMVLVTIYVMILPSSITHIENQLTWDLILAKPQKVSFSVIGAAILRTIYSFGGWTTPHMVQNEIKDPIKTLKLAAPLSISFVIVLYLFLNVAYLIVIPSTEIIEGGELIGGILFEKVFGEILGRIILSTIIAISSASTLLVVVFADTRLIQSIAREGFLPFSEVLSSNYPFDTPLAALTLNVLISTTVLFLPESGDLYNYIISMQIYPNQLFHAILCFGVYKARNRFPKVIAPIRTSYVSIIFCFISSIVIFIAPLTSPETLVRSYSFGGLVMFVLASLYWFLIVKILPWYNRYTIQRRTILLDHDGLKVKKWDRTYY